MPSAGCEYCLAAAERADRAGALEEVADALAMALALVPADDPRRGRLLARRGLVLALTKRADEAAAIAIEAAELIAVTEGRAAAAEYLAEIANMILVAGTAQAAWAVARHGLTFAEDRRDLAWAFLRAPRPRSPGCRGPRASRHPRRHAGASGGGRDREVLRGCRAKPGSD